MKITSREMNRIAAIVDKVVGELDIHAADMELRRIVRSEAEAVRATLGEASTKGAERLRASLDRLVALMEMPAAVEAERPRGRDVLFSLKSLARAFAALTGGALLALPGLAAAADVGGAIVHPISNAQLTITEVVAMGVVAIDATGTEYFIFNVPTVGTSIADPNSVPDADGNPTGTTTVIGYKLMDGTSVDTYVLNASGVPVYREAGQPDVPIYEIVYGTPASGTVGSPGYTPPVASGSLQTVTSLADGGIDAVRPEDTAVSGSGSGRITVIQRGSNGSNGRTGVFFIPASSGSAGKTGPAVNVTQQVDNAITANGGAGITYASIGGNGGHGGGSYVNLAGGGKSGGQGGSGGTVNVTLNGNGSVTTSGSNAHGIVIQSRAGRGGNGGDSWATTGSAGNGGSSNSGGSVTVNNRLDVTTTGTRSHGMLVQSLGGGAGDSGSSYGLFGAGGDAGWGGHGGSVSVTNGGNIATWGQGSFGILAQSIGGQGGDSGNVGGLAALGGHAGSGGNGGAVSVTTLEGSYIYTDGSGSHGIVAQSIGGGGGTGGTSGGLVAMGSRGGVGGNGGSVQVYHNADLETHGAGAYGILAQSIGGGGGTAGTTAGAVALGVGGNIGGSASSVTVNVGASGTIHTSGLTSAGIVAQSIGGGGGDGSSSGGFVSLGGGGGSAGHANQVTVTNQGEIITGGAGADAIIAQSIGGGGGRGGATGGFVALGGKGSAGGNASTASVTNTGTIRTSGDLSRGMLVQSIGGGGGAAGAAGGVFASGGTGGVGGSSVARIGATSSAESSGAAVAATNSGSIVTSGKMSTAIQAQSIGGGGGDGANAGGFFMAIGGNGAKGGAAGAVTVTNSGSLITTGDDSHGILAQSIGGGGGNGGSTVSAAILTSVSIGGDGAGGGKGGVVTINQSNNPDAASVITTNGDRSYGVLAQSIGGGGGNGGYAISTAIGAGAGVAVAIGGDGAGGGNGDAVNYTGFARINTGTFDGETRGGSNSTGLLLQSIGGGGGNGGFTIANSVTGLVGAAVSVAIGGSGDAGGDGGNITMRDAGGSITTRGDFASGLVAQSIGGGGGNGGFSIGTSVLGGLGAAVTATIGGDGANGGRGGVVDINYTGNISTLGMGATGVLLQSISGGGGNGGFSIATGVGGIAAPAITVGLGGSGGQGQAGNSVIGVIDGNISTYGILSNGFVAQSIGGGGGSGGYNVSGSVSGGIGGLGIAVGIGGTGGGGGAGGMVDASVLGQIYTQGMLSTAFIAQSIGGGGGSGGYNISGAVAGGLGSGAITVGLGGAGGSGGDAGAVTAYVGDDILTEGMMSDGLVAQSIGGGGGNGGFNVSGSIAGGLGAGSISVGLGGSGGSAGDAGAVVATADGQIGTKGDYSNAYVAQSIGGGGGAGGFNVSGSIAGGLGSGSISVGLGGGGGGAGNGGTVTATANDTIITEGRGSFGMIAQSIGGGGGAGAFNVSGGIGGAAFGSGSISVGLGGSGGGGGNAAAVIAKAKSIQTSGDSATAFLAQSVGGSGGAGGMNVSGAISGSGMGAGSISVGLGGSGAGGGDGSTVDAEVIGNVLTLGNYSEAVVAQSIGGGGGNGAFNVAFDASGAGIGAGGLAFGMGGSGAGGGHAALVELDITGNVETRGSYANAVVAQSVGGGGGAGGFNASGGIAGAGTGSGTISIGLGGSAGSGGNAGDVNVTLEGLTRTAGTESRAIIAQSLGGGGGAGGFNVAGSVTGAGTGSGSINFGLGGSGGAGGNAGAVNLSVTGAQITSGQYAAITAGKGAVAITAQSVGGGGGAGGFNVAGGISAAGTGAGNISVGLGGTGGDGGNAGAVLADIIGSIDTSGEDATGLLAQSVGGGGGSGGMNVTGNITAATQGAGNIGVGVGGMGGGGGDAGTVTANLEGDVVTRMAGANAIVAQSIGGGGGSGGLNVSGGIAASSQSGGTVTVGVGGFGGDGGDASDVSGLVRGDIGTQMANSAGLTYQSIGGGGGSGGMNVSGSIAAGLQGAGAISVGVGGFGGAGGDAGNASVDYAGDIYTQGRGSYAALVQSIGGGGGSGGMNVSGVIAGSQQTAGALGFGLGGFGGTGGNAGDVLGTLTGNVTTMGDGAWGTMLQSVGGSGGSGGLNVTGSVALTAGSTGASIGLGVGGFGGGGGDAGRVEGTVTGTYYTKGKDAFGAVAQSIGGGGGAGGINVTGALSFSQGNSVSVGMGLGGFGGAGGSASDVDFTRLGDTQTMGENADGVLMQSVGGSGGAGAINVTGGMSFTNGSTATAITIGVGGFGGGGGNAGDVTGNVQGNVWASGAATDFVETFVNEEGETTQLRRRDNGSNGVVAQSIGGGGGNGGLNVSGGIAFAPPQSADTRTATLGLGGFGGAGGDAGRVDLTVGSATNAERIQVQANGDNRSAVMAQSIGGGGGNGGINVAGGITLDGQLTLGMGGFGGDGGIGSTVDLAVDANLFAAGSLARGLLAQSIGGGGGAGAINVAGGFQADQYTSEPSVVFGIGGFGGAGGRSDDVTVLHSGNIVVEGKDTVGALVQSIAGGGGSGGLNVSAAASIGDKNSFAVSAGIGGMGGTGDDAGDVNFTSVGNILVNSKVVSTIDGGTEFASTDFTGGGAGVLAQSIGGGGGSGGINVAGAISRAGSPIALGMGGSGGSGGNAGSVTVTRGWTEVGGVQTAAPGLIRTFGEGTSGVVAQSIGGGGGDAAYNLALGLKPTGSGQQGSEVGILMAIGGSGAGAGSGDVVDVRHNGNIVTQGNLAKGIVAQSIGGGGGNATYNVAAGLFRDARASMTVALGGGTGAAGRGEAVSVEHIGDIITQGRGATGILAQSIGGGGGSTGNDISMAEGASASVDISIGRKGGSGGEGGTVDVDAEGRIYTLGDNADGILVQSIGGGGGASSNHEIGFGYETEDEQSYGGSLAVGIEGGLGATADDVSVRFAGELVTTGREARGIFAQSIGGGGGAAGELSTGLSGTSVAVAIGATGGQGALSGDVSAFNTGVIQTAGAYSDGILAQAIGGGGGAGSSVQISNKAIKPPANASLATASLAVGGNGGDGALGGDVLVDNAGRILTSGANAYGVRAQSIGGGGGVAGNVLNYTLQGMADSQSIELNVGGSGGVGAASGDVDVTNTGLIYTRGADAIGVSANAIGGGGGDAGSVVSIAATFAPGNSNNRVVANIGGSGGEGGVGGDVTVTNRAVSGEEFSGTILTEGARAYGILAQSIGGGGGNGATVVNIQAGLSGNGSFGAGLSLGGRGGEGGYAGSVTVDNSGLIGTRGDGAHGIVAQSIGGGGGNGGLSLLVNAQLNPNTTAPMVNIGGMGADGGDGGVVRVDNSGSIITEGARAHGIVAQSIGGGGGNANFGISAGTDLDAMAINNTLAFALGLTGGGVGGAGGNVIVNHTGDITVLGENSVAIKAESINGGGGTLALDLDGIVGFIDEKLGNDPLAPAPLDPAALVQMGADGASGMNANRVDVTTTGSFQMAGAGAIGDLTQSIAGGGGTVDLKARVASAALQAGAVPVEFTVALGGQNGSSNSAGGILTAHSGNLTATGDMATAILTQAIGGGGGVARVNLSADAGGLIGQSQMQLGASQSLNERGGAISRTQTGDVLTGGAFGIGTLLQSIGGGGGSLTASFDGANTGSAILLGATNATGASGNDVTGLFNGGTQTFGNHAVGLVLQSIGGGGGTVRVQGQSAADVVLGGHSGTYGDAGGVSLTHGGGVYTSGIFAHGLVLQSIGGGGGAVFGDLAGGMLDLSADNGGNGQSIFLRQNDVVVTSGDNAYGAIAQSLGGGGGWVDGLFAGSANGAGAGGQIDLAFGNAVYAVGQNSVAVFAQSAGSDGAGNININLDGAVRGGSGNGAGIQLEGGLNNQIVTATSLSAISGWAIRASGGNDTVVNNGMVAGNIDLGGGDNRFLNGVDGSFLAFNTIRLRDSGISTLSARSMSPSAVAVPAGAATFTNEGVLRLGLEASSWPVDLAAGETFGDYDDLLPAVENLYLGARAITTVELDGNFVQTATGRTLFDVAFGSYASDQVKVSGDAVVSGTVDINLVWLEDLKPITLFDVAGESFVNAANPQGTLALNFALKASDDGIQLLVDSDFGQSFLRPNEVRLGGHMDSALETGGATGIGRLMSALGNMVAGQEDLYQSIFAELNPEGHVASMQTQYYGATSFANQLFGCDVAASANERCVWGKGSTTAFDQEATGEYWGATSRVFNARFGMQQQLNSDWAVALAGGYNSLARQQISNGRMSTQGDGFDVGIGAARRWAKGTELQLTASAGWQWLESQRYGYVFDVMTAKSEGQNGYAQLGAELGHTIRAGDFFFRPALNAQATALHTGAYKEEGWDGLGARVVSDTQWIGAIEPKITSGWTFDPASGVRADLAITAGRVHRSEDGIYLPIQLIGSKTASDPALITTPLDRSAWKLGFEAKVVTDAGVSFQAGYDGQLGDKANVHTGSVSVRWQF